VKRKERESPTGVISALSFNECWQMSSFEVRTLTLTTSSVRVMSPIVTLSITIHITQSGNGAFVVGSGVIRTKNRKLGRFFLRSICYDYKLRKEKMKNLRSFSVFMLEEQKKMKKKEEKRFDWKKEYLILMIDD